MRSAKVGLAMFAVVMLAGCSLFSNGNGNGNGGGTQEALSLIQDIFLLAGVGGGLDVEIGFKSPTVEQPVGHQQAHVAAMVLCKRLAAENARITEWVMQPVNFELVAKVAKDCRCPVCKGFLMAAGCIIHYTQDLVTVGYDQDIWIEKPDGTTWGKPETTEPLAEVE
jgi:hypothetical protein